jgi:hypothetical protein
MFVVMRDLLQPTTRSRGGHAGPHTKFLTGPVGFRLIALDHVLQRLWEDDGSACRAIVLDGVEIL